MCERSLTQTSVCSSVSGGDTWVSVLKRQWGDAASCPGYSLSAQAITPLGAPHGRECSELHQALRKGESSPLVTSPSAAFFIYLQVRISVQGGSCGRMTKTELSPAFINPAVVTSFIQQTRVTFSRSLSVLCVDSEQCHVS